MTLKALLADDERLARVALRDLLESRDDIEIVAEADSVADTVAKLKTVRPDVLFLDIEMGDGLGFDIFDRTLVTCKVIFVTAYSDHALRAFDINALDYLVKPVHPMRLERALARLEASGASTPAAFASSPPSAESTEPRLTPQDLVCLQEAKSMKFARVEQIVCITAADDYSEVHLANGQMALVHQPLRRWGERLPDCFVQTHRSTIVNLNFVDEIEQTGHQWVVRLRTQEQPLTMSRRYAQTLRKRLQTLG